MSIKDEKFITKVISLKPMDDETTKLINSYGIEPKLWQQITMIMSLLQVNPTPTQVDIELGTATLEHLQVGLVS